MTESVIHPLKTRQTRLRAIRELSYLGPCQWDLSERSHFTARGLGQLQYFNNSVRSDMLRDLVRECAGG